METPNFQFPTPKHEVHEEVEGHEAKNVELLRGLRSLCGLRARVLGVGRWAFTCALLLGCALTLACGKKGPPLFPYVRQPKAAEITSARRVGNDVYLTVTIPTANIDDSTPASLAQIEVWAVTLGTPPPSQFTTVASRVATIPVARYADPSDKSGTVVPDPTTGALQGTSVTIRETLTTAEMTARVLPPPKGSSAAAAPPPDSAAPEILRRFYITIPFSERRKAGPPSAVVEVPMTLIPDKVQPISVKRTGHEVALLWEPAGGLVGWLLDRALPAEPAPVEERRPAGTSGKTSAAPAGPVLYNVYREIDPVPVAVPGPKPIETPWAFSPAVPINKEPLTTLTFKDPDVPFDGRQRCYYVRAVRGTGAQRVEGERSEPSCTVPIDDEAPAAPTGVTASAEEGSISLRWEPNGEEDLGGYLVLRRDPGSDTLRQLTLAPIEKTTYTDPSVTSGQMYTYLVQAVDKQKPPNVSEPAEVPVTAR